MRGVDPVSVGVRFLVFLFLQVFIFRQVSLGWGGAEYVFLFVTPLFVGLLPLRTPKPLVVLAAFGFGLAVDLFYETLGLHAAAATLLGYARQFVLTALAPRDGYKVKASPDGKDLSRAWWVQYVGILSAVYCLGFFCFEAFAPHYWQQILLKTLFTVPLTWLVGTLLALVIQPRL